MVSGLPYIIQSRRVLVAPLNWGLGHATRCIPIIRDLVLNGKEVYIASDGEALVLLQKEFPDLPSIVLPSYDIYYNGTSMLLDMLKSGPRILKAIKAENNKTREICKQYRIDAIISDHRYGVRNKKIPSIIVAHQLYIPYPTEAIARVISRVNKNLIRKFNSCWIPDYPPPSSLAGKISNTEGLHDFHYLGPLSRLEKQDNVPVNLFVAAILSGPEPARSKLERKLIPIVRAHNGLLVKGKPDLDQGTESDIIPFLGSEKLNKLILSTEWVICRSGYTSIMDLMKLDKKAILIPTPGQPEQLYLGDYLSHKHPEKFFLVKEDETDKILSILSAQS